MGTPDQFQSREHIAGLVADSHRRSSLPRFTLKWQTPDLEEPEGGFEVVLPQAVSRPTPLEPVLNVIATSVLDIQQPTKAEFEDNAREAVAQAFR